MSKKLTHEFISTRVKHDKIHILKKINFWGNDIEEISILQEMQNLEVISLSVNKIKTLKDFSNLKNLKELYLRKNQITDIDEINYLTTCPNLRILWISENPIVEKKNYRLIVISQLPNLEKLDDDFISEEEKLQALNFTDSQNYKNSSGEKSNKNLKLELGDKNINNCEENERNIQITRKKKLKNEENDCDITINLIRKKSTKLSNEESNQKIKNKSPKENKDINSFYNENEKNSKKDYQEESLNSKKKENMIKDSYNNNPSFLKRLSSKKSSEINLSRNSINKSENFDEYSNEFDKQKNNNLQNQYPKKKNHENNFNNDDYINGHKKRNLNYQSRNDNIVNSILMLMNEVNNNDLVFLRNEMDKKLGYY